MMRRLRLASMALALVIGVAAPDGIAEYGDVVLNKRSEAEGMRPVVFPHWFHRVRFRCSVCHGELGFRMRAGANDVTMKDIMDGQFCGMCHNGQVAWSAERCDLCHSGMPGLKSGVLGGHRSTGPGKW
jgi:c(7)-type cytochrome triheme protein